MPVSSINAPATPHRRAANTLLLLSLAVLLALSAGPARLFADAQTHAVHSVFVAPPKGGKPNALDKRVTEKLRQNSAVRVVDNANLADAVLHLDSVFWPVGSMTLNPRSQSGSFTNYQGYASANLAAPSGQVLWSYLATPKRFRMTGIIDNLADQISERLLATFKTGIALQPETAASGNKSSTTGSALRAAGATFPAPLYLKWFQSFAEVPGGVPISYDAIGSVKGLQELTAGTVEIAASDIPPSTVPSFDASLLRLPSVAGGIVPIYDVPGARDGIDLTGDVLADIYSGKITRWSDPRIRSLNRSTHLPDAPIAVIHRSDGSGTTFVWTSYLALSSPEWKSRTGATVDWPTGIGMAGNAGVADAVAKTPNSIGYVEMTFAIQHHLTYAGVRNPAGRMVKASLDSISAAAESAQSKGSTFGGPILNSPEVSAYPIATFTWLVVPATDGDERKRASIKRFLEWMLGYGQRACSELGYAPLPRDLVKEEQKVVEGLK